MSEDCKEKVIKQIISQAIHCSKGEDEKGKRIVYHAAEAALRGDPLDLTDEELTLAIRRLEEALGV